MKTSRRIFAVLLVLLLVLTTPVAAHAAVPENASPNVTHVHSYHVVRKYAAYGSTSYVNATYCHGLIYTVWACDCGDSYTTGGVVGDIAHSYQGVNSSCNGTYQTLTYRCRYCTNLKVVTRACPNGPHSGACSALPFGVIHEDTI